MRECPSERLNTTVILCFTEALQRVFSRHLMSGYPPGNEENESHLGIAKSQNLERRLLD
jgi:hypothetical protein